jgi:DNA polymerase-3 subunit epsilon
MYAIVDIETTGGYASANGITEIAVYIHNGTRVVKKFETLINPLQKIPNYITALTGIDNAMVADAPTFEEIAETLFELLNDKIFVAHSVNFDFSFIKHQFGAKSFPWLALL